MRVLVIGDMEGVAGICRWEQVTGGKPLYEECRKLYTEEMNAAVRGARAGGATDVVVMDCHGAGGGWSFNSLVPELLDDGCEWVVQSRWTEYTEVLEQGCDAALFVGMHAMAGTADGVLSHTVSGTQWHQLEFNGVPVGETAINAALCGTWGCPVVMVTGDRAVCREARALLGDDVATVEVKQGLGRFSARHVAPARARAAIEDAARAAVRAPRVAPYDPGSPCTIEVELASPEHAQPYEHRPGVERLSGRRIAARADDWLTAWNLVYVD
ncbi:MAG TPA: M55 family metallopeptidase [Actinomycetota bacterium]|nr:M55 family metallopeptidase [Actinomycetota bacterium]